ncbi:MAG TPA: diguanylate cyclase [Fontimonas sp.]
MALVALLFAIAQWALGAPDWHYALIPVALSVPLHWMMSTRRPFGVFIVALPIMVVMLVGLCSYATLTIGPGSGFHLILIAMLPVVVVSGRISVTAKWLTVTLFTVYLVVLDTVAVDSPGLATLSPMALGVMRAINLAIPALCTTRLVLHYFQQASRQHAALLKLATIDPLTGLYNRRQIGERARQMVAECQRYKQPLSIILCDVDHFKSINDRFGHEAGDEVLLRIGGILGQGVRSIDCVGRWGGEEFLLLLPQTDLDSATLVAERLRTRIAVQFESKAPNDPPVTATMGVSLFRPSDTLEKAISRADAALYAGKASGRNRVTRDAELPGSA